MPPQRELLPIEALMTARLGSYTHVYDERDVALYALGLGCGVDELRYVYESADGFAPLPTFAVIPAHPIAMGVPLEQYLPAYDRAKALHGEQYLELRAPLPAAATVVTRAQVVDVQDKGSGAVVVLRTVTHDASSGAELAVNEFTTFALGTGRFQGAAAPLPRPAAATAANAPPPRPPDAVLRLQTSAGQAALYRLSGDLNPLHIDPAFSARAGFPSPILHGLATLGMSVRALLRAYAGGEPDALASVKARFATHVLPGEALLVEAWADAQSGRVVFQTRVEARGGLAISHAALVLRPGRLVPPRGAARL